MKVAPKSSLRPFLHQALQLYILFFNRVCLLFQRLQQFCWGGGGLELLW